MAADLIDTSVVESERGTSEGIETTSRGKASAAETHSVSGDSHEASASKPAPATAHTSAELLETLTGSAVDSPLCMTCGTKMRPAGSCHVCEGCGSTSGCT